MTNETQSAPPEAFVDMVVGDLFAHGDWHRNAAIVQEKWDGGLGRLWRAAQAAAYEEAARIAEMSECPNYDPDCFNRHNEIAAAIRERAGRKE